MTEKKPAARKRAEAARIGQAEASGAKLKPVKRLRKKKETP